MSNFHTAKQLKPSQLTNFRTQRFNVTFRARWFGGWTKGGVWWGSFLAEKHNLSDLLKENLESTFKWLKKHKKTLSWKACELIHSKWHFAELFCELPNSSVLHVHVDLWLKAGGLDQFTQAEPSHGKCLIEAGQGAVSAQFVDFVRVNQPMQSLQRHQKKPGLSCFDSQEIWWIFGSEGLELGIRHLSSAFLWWVWLRSMHLKSI